MVFAKIGSFPIILLNSKFIWDPIIGCVPALLISSENSKAPQRLKLSLSPADLILFSLQNLAKFEILIAPSQIEYCVCILKCVKFLYSLPIDPFYITIAYAQSIIGFFCYFSIMSCN